jgi:hypothetical protein
LSDPEGANERVHAPQCGTPDGRGSTSACDGDDARTFLRARFDALMVAFERDMIRWFGADVAE